MPTQCPIVENAVKKLAILKCFALDSWSAKCLNSWSFKQSVTLVTDTNSPLFSDEEIHGLTFLCFSCLLTHLKSAFLFFSPIGWFCISRRLVCCFTITFVFVFTFKAANFTGKAVAATLLIFPYFSSVSTMFLQSHKSLNLARFSQLVKSILLSDWL